MNGSGFAYLGDDPARYKSVFEIRSKDDPKAWSDLINVCKVLNTTPPDKLEQALEPLLDVDEALKYLALDKALINNDGYWTRASDFDVYEDPAGRFHVIPQDADETLQGPEGGRATLDPFAARTRIKRCLPDCWPCHLCGSVISPTCAISRKSGSTGTKWARRSHNTRRSSPPTSRPTRASWIPRRTSSRPLPKMSPSPLADQVDSADFVEAAEAGAAGAADPVE
jgi:hypothetical protein